MSASETAASVTAPFWLHLDVDVLDQDVFEATDYLMPNGMTWDELVSALVPLARSSSMIGASTRLLQPGEGRRPWLRPGARRRAPDRVHRVTADSDPRR